MNKDQMKGAAKQVGGEIQEQAGKLSGKETTRAKGHAKEAEGKVQQDWGEAKEATRERDARLERERREKSGL